MRTKFLYMISFFALAIILTGCAVDRDRHEIIYPNNPYQQPFPKHKYPGAPLSRHDQRWNPQLANW